MAIAFLAIAIFFLRLDSLVVCMPSNRMLIRAVNPNGRSRFDIIGVAAVQKHYGDGWETAERIAVKAAAHRWLAS